MMTTFSAPEVNMWLQRTVSLPPYQRGFHLITDQIVSQLPEIHRIKVGMLHLLLQHTSASLSLNENADPTVRQDLEAVFNRLVPEQLDFYRHTAEGPDDLPAHIKSALIGVSLTLPIASGQLQLGTWQGIVLGEHRNRSGRRAIVTTLHGQT